MWHEFQVSNIWTSKNLENSENWNFKVLWVFFCVFRCSAQSNLRCIRYFQLNLVYMRWDSTYARWNWREMRFNEPPKWLFTPSFYFLAVNYGPQPAFCLLHIKSKSGHHCAVWSWWWHGHVSDRTLLRVANRLRCHGYGPGCKKSRRLCRHSKYHITFCLQNSRW